MFLKVTFEAVYNLEESIDLQGALTSALDELRGQGAAQVVKIEKSDKDFVTDAWRRNGLFEIDVPVPQKVVFD